MITGREVETTVEASIETNMPRSRPERASRTWRRVMPDLVRAAAGGETDAMGCLLDDEDVAALVIAQSLTDVNYRVFG